MVHIAHKCLNLSVPLSLLLSSCSAGNYPSFLPSSRKVNERLISQLEKVWHTTNIYWHSPIHECVEKLVAKMPGDLKVVYFTNSGSEANELAMLMASLYTGSTDFVTLRCACPCDACTNGPPSCGTASYQHAASCYNVLEGY